MWRMRWNQRVAESIRRMVLSFMPSAASSVGADSIEAQLSGTENHRHDVAPGGRVDFWTGRTSRPFRRLNYFRATIRRLFPPSSHRGTTMIERRFVNAHQLLDKLRCHANTARNWNKQGKIPGCVRMYREMLWVERTVDEWIAQGCPDVRGSKEVKC